jgi:hypothetical protein
VLPLDGQSLRPQLGCAAAFFCAYLAEESRKREGFEGNRLGMVLSEHHVECHPHGLRAVLLLDGPELGENAVKVAASTP